MKIIIIGCGRVGQSLAEKLNADGNKVTVIDKQAAKVESITNRCDIMGIVGNGATHTVQQDAGVDSADLLIAVTDSDELNLLCCVIAKKEGNCQTIARVKNPQYSEEAPYLKEQLGLAMVINPEYAAAEEIARVLRFPAALKIEPFAKGKVELIKFKLAKASKLIGMSVKEMAGKYHSDVLVCTVERGEEAHIAGGDFVFEEKDVVSIIGTPKNANEFFKKIQYTGESIKNALVVGGGIKVSRVVVLYKGATHEMKRALHPKQVKKISMDGHIVEHEVVRNTNAFIIAYIMLFVVSLLLISLDGATALVSRDAMTTNFTAVAATLNNIGPGLDAVGPIGNFSFYHPLSKLVFIFDMLAGRLELFPMLLLFHPATWKK